jgi:hypothetical protein
VVAVVWQGYKNSKASLERGIIEGEEAATADDAARER